MKATKKAEMAELENRSLCDRLSSFSHRKRVDRATSPTRADVPPLVVQKEGKVKEVGGRRRGMRASRP